MKVAVFAGKVILGSVAMWFAAMFIAVSGWRWVGGGGSTPIPWPAMVVALSPCAVDAIVGLVYITRGILHRSGASIASGIIALVAAAALLAFTAFAIGMLSIG